MKYKKIILVGMMGAGKSAISRELSASIQINAFELDEIFVLKNNISIKECFAKLGEEFFRNKESEILKEIMQKQEYIISTGGGIILNSTNRDLIFHEDIISIYLKAKPETIFKRIKNDKNRPLLQVGNQLEKIKQLILSREKYYNMAEYTINTDNKSIKEICKEIALKL